MVSSGALAACAGQAQGGAGQSAALPGPTGGDIIINFGPNWQATWNNTARLLNQQFIDEHYNAKHPGVYVQVVANVQGAAAQQVSASLAGKGFLDVFHDCCSDFATLYAANLMTPLDSFIQKDNVDRAIWGESRLANFTVNGHLMALPSSNDTVAVAYRSDLFNHFGVALPDPAWNATQAQSVWESCTQTATKGGSPLYGVQLFNTPWDETLDFWLHGWGTTKMNSAGTAFTGDDAKGQACLTYLQNLAVHNVAQPRLNIVYFSGARASQCVFRMTGTWELIAAAEQMGDSIPWDILPVPNWPAGRSTYTNLSYYMLNSATKHPEHAWEFLKWIAGEQTYPLWLTKITLVRPPLLSLEAQWQQLVQQAAPPLADKQLQWFSDPDQHGYAWAERFFKYQPSEAVTIMNNWGGQIWSNAVSVPRGLQQMAHQLGALEAAAAPASPSVSA